MGGLFMLLERNLTPSENSFQERLVEISGIITAKTHNHHNDVANDSS